MTRSCLTSYTILSGARTLYDNGNDVFTPALVLPSNAIASTWLQDPEAKWIWWTTSWTYGVFHFKDVFDMAQWAVNRVNTAVLKIVADDFFKVVFNGEMLKDFELGHYYYTQYLQYDLKGKLKGASAFQYQSNVLDIIVQTEYPANWEGIVYRIDITFT